MVTDRLAECRRASDALAAGIGVLTRQRDRSVIAARQEGATLAEIGAAIGMSGVGVGKLIARQPLVTWTEDETMPRVKSVTVHAIDCDMDEYCVCGAQS